MPICLLFCFCVLVLVMWRQGSFKLDTCAKYCDKSQSPAPLPGFVAYKSWATCWIFGIKGAIWNFILRCSLPTKRVNWPRNHENSFHLEQSFMILLHCRRESFIVFTFRLFSVPKPVFQTSRKSHNYLKSHHHHHQNQEILSPQHEELVRYMNDCEFVNLDEGRNVNRVWWQSLSSLSRVDNFIKTTSRNRNESRNDN